VNASGESNVASVTTPSGGGGTFTFAPSDDAYVDQVASTTNFYDSNRHVAALGLGLEFPHTGPTPLGSVAINVHGDVQFLERRVILKEDPADPVGDAILGGHVFNIGATLATTF
jgi:hypothetical protein